MLRTAIELHSYRDATEDRAAVLHLGTGVLIVVADGVGGRPNGAAAAERIVVLAAAAARDGGNVPGAGPLQRLLQNADGELLNEPAVGEAAAIVAAAGPEGVAGATAGDCEAWIIDGEVRQKLSRTRKPYLGSGAATPYPFQAPFPVGASLLIATDGLFKYADEATICAAASGNDLHAAAAVVAELARSGAGSFHDDLALVLCRRSA